MRWAEIEVSAGPLAQELVAGLVSDLCGGASLSGDGLAVTGWLPADDRAEDRLLLLRSRLDALPPEVSASPVEITVRPVEDDGWLLAYREFFQPRQAILWARAKALSPARIMLHSCGGLYPLIPGLIEAGLDILQPVQTSAAGMAPERLKAEFGRDLCFWGGGCDTREVLPHGTPAEVAEDVRRRVGILAPGGGYVFQQVHNVMADVPPENVVAMLHRLWPDNWGPRMEGALRAAELHPERFAAVSAVSAALWRSFEDGVGDAFDGAGDYARNDVYGGVRRLSGLPVRVDCGRQDPFYKANVAFAAALPEPPAGGFTPGGHDDAYWTRVAPAEIDWIGAQLARA